MIECGTVVEVKPAQAVAKVNVLGRVTEWLPLLQQANSYRRKFTPIRVGEQVVVLANRYIVGAIFNQDCSEPSGASDHCDVIEYEDGTRITYDTQAKQLAINAVGSVDVTCKSASVDATESVKVTCKTASVNATESIKEEAPLITMNNGTGVVTAECICAFTGKPHCDMSATVKAGK